MIEDSKSFELYQKKQLANNNRRWLKEKDTNKNDDKNIYRPDHKKTQHGMMIDAGSQGTRVHVYEFKARILNHKHDIQEVVHGLKLSFPTTDTRWTNRLKPGLDSFAFIEDDTDLMEQVKAYLDPLFNFTKDVLMDKQKHWSKYPIYLKATGGLRALPRPYRIRLIHVVRQIMQDKKFNPYFFEEEHARVISGEEEAIYGWAAVNFVKGALIKESQGLGSVIQTSEKTYGVLEMGGASAQIGFFEPNGDVMANLFKLQIGAAKHWNVYVHSFLYFGVELSYDILNAELYLNDSQQRKLTADNTGKHNNNKGSNKSNTTSNMDGNLGVYNPCLPGKSQYLFSSRIRAMTDGTFLPLSSPMNASLLEVNMYSSIMMNDNDKGDYDLCYNAVQKLLRKNANAWCNFAHDRDCSFAGIYQPPLPIRTLSNPDPEGFQFFGEFVATSNFYEILNFMNLASSDSSKKITMKQIRDQSKYICEMSLSELIIYNNNKEKPYSDLDELNAMCFRSVFIGAFLVDGVGFSDESSTIIAADVINGQKLGWALGSMLYETNTLPWEFESHSHLGHIMSSSHRLMEMIGGSGVNDRLVGGTCGILFLVTVLIGLLNIWSSRNKKRNCHSEPEQPTETLSLLQSKTVDGVTPKRYST